MWNKQSSYGLLFLGKLFIFLSLAQNAFCVSKADNASLFDMSLEELLDLKVTSVMRREESISESPSAIQVITHEQIRLSGATSLPEALRLATNLQVAQQNSHQWIITARGFSSDAGNKLLVLIDGRSVYTPLFSGVFWERQDYLLEDIERIEVISGPGGTLWGANAVNGVINIITRNAKDTRGLFLEGGVGTQLKQQYGIRYGDSIGDATNYRVYGKFTERDDEYLSNGSRGNDAWEIAQFGFRLDSELTEQDTFTLQGDYYANKASPSPPEEDTTTGGNILSRWTRKFASGSEFQFQVYFDKTSLEFNAPPFVFAGTEITAAGLFENDLETFDLDFQHNINWQDSPHKLIWGIAYRSTDEKTSNAPGLGFIPENLKQELPSAFIQAEISLLPDELAFIMGTKVERNDYTGTEWEPNVRLQWKLSDEKMFWSAISRAVRMPSRIDRDLVQPPPPFPIVVLSGGSDFVSENVLAYELGYRAQVTDKLSLSIASFYNEYTDIRSTNITPDTLIPLVFENNVEGENRGFEFNANFQPTRWWRINLGYNFIEHDMRVKEGEFDINNALNETADPKHQFSIRSSIVSDKFEFDLGLRWVDKLPADLNGEVIYVDSYAEMDIRLGWQASDNLELSLVGQNLLHEHHQEFGNPGPQTEEIGRNVFLKCQLRY